MDPNQLLTDLREAVAAIRTAVEGDSDDAKLDTGYTLADAVEAVDEHLKAGHDLPDEWSQARPVRPDYEGILVAGIREKIAAAVAEDGAFDPAPARVVISVSEWDNGYFYDDHGAVVLAGEVYHGDDIDLYGTEAADALTELSAEHSLGQHDGLCIDLATGEVDDVLAFHNEMPART